MSTDHGVQDMINRYINDRLLYVATETGRIPVIVTDIFGVSEDGIPVVSCIHADTGSDEGHISTLLKVNELMIGASD